jgi:GxxExxY protein
MLLYLTAMDDSEIREQKRTELDRCGKIVFESALAVHKEMGPGLLEAVYHHCMIKEFRLKGLNVGSNIMIPLLYKQHPVEKDYIIDLLVEDEIIVEIKAVENLLPVHAAQILSYLKIADKRLGFLVNFHVPLLKTGFKRFVNNF